MALGPTQAFTKENVKSRWMERYTSDSINKKFLGLPRGVYLGFIPSPSGLVLTLKTDVVVTILAVGGAFSVNTTLTGPSGTATIRVVSPGYLLVDNVVGTFLPGEALTAPGPATATVGEYRTEAVSFGRVVSATALVPGRSEDMLDILTGDPVILNFTGFPDGAYYVILTANYQVGVTTSAQILSRTTPPPNGGSEVLICIATKVGANVTTAAIAPASRHEPFAFAGTRIGFMPGGALEALNTAILSSAEVVAARRRMDGTTAATFNPLLPQTTGLPDRLNDDMTAAAMAQRLGKQLVEVRGNDLTLAAPVNNANISGSFSARNRDFDPVRDITSLALPAGVQTGIVAGGSDLIGLTLSGISGAFATGTQLVGLTSGATGIIRIVSGTTLHLSDIQGVFFLSEIVAVGGGPPSGTFASIDYREGAATSEDPPVSTSDAVRNVMAFVNNADGRRPALADGTVIFGRLFFGPNGLAGGQFTLTGTLNFTNGSSSVAGTGTLFTTEILAGDIIEGPDGRFYEVLSVGAINALTLVDSYVGVTSTGTLRRRRRFIVKFFTRSGGTETQVSMPAATYHTFFPAWFSLQQPNADYDISRLIPDAQPVGVKGEKGGAGTTSLRDIVNFIEGSNIAITVAESGGKINVTVSNTFVGGASFPGFGGTPPADGGAGFGGASGTASRSDHQHPASSVYRPSSYRLYSFFGAVNPLGASFNIPTAGGVTPRAVFSIFSNSAGPSGAGFAISTTPSQQASEQTSAVFFSSFLTGGIINDGVGDNWEVTQMTTGSDVVITRTVGGGSVGAAFLILGDG